MIVSTKRYGCPSCKHRTLAYMRGPYPFGGKSKKLVNYYQCSNCTFKSSSPNGIPWQELSTDNPGTSSRIGETNMAAKKKGIPIVLGDRVRDTVTGFTGIVVSITMYLDDSPSWGITGEGCGTDGLPSSTVYLGAWRIEKIKRKKGKK